MADKLLNPLDWRAPIVDKGGRPTTEFQRKWAQQQEINGDIPGVLPTGTVLGNISGAPANAAPVLFVDLVGVGSALKWTTPRDLEFTGDATGTLSVDGSGDVSAPLTLATVNADVGVFGNGTTVAAFVVNAKGLIEAAANVPIVSAPKWTTPRTLTLGTDLTGSVAFDGSADFTLNASIAADAVGPAELADTTVTPGTYGGATDSAQIVVDAQGRITSAVNVPISGGGGGSGALELISEVVTSGSAADVTFSAIAATYRHLEVVVNGRGNAGGVSNIDLRLQLNGDVGANYDYAVAESSGSGGTAFFGAAAQTSIFLGRLSAATAPADVPSLIEFEIGDYRGTTFQKSISSRCAHKLANNAGGTNQLTAGGAWRSSAAVTAVRLFPSGSTFVDGTLVSLYGRM